MSKFILIAAVAQNGVIGNNGKIPWHDSHDLRFFREKTLGWAVVMGRKTFESLPRPLEGRRVIVLSKTLENAPGADIARNIGEAVSLAAPYPRVFIAGGAETYKAFMPLVSEAYISLIDSAPDGDTLMPDLKAAPANWEIVEEWEGGSVIHYDWT